MNEHNDHKNTIKDRLDEVYRVSIVHEDNLQEVRKFKFSLFKLYSFLLLTLFIVSAIVISIIFFTPIRTLVPGYADINNNVVFIELNKTISNLETQVSDQSTYIDGILNMVVSPSTEEKLNKSSLEGSNENGYVTLAILDQKSFICPIKGVIEKSFKVQDKHLGVDIVAPKDSAIKSILDGVVINSDWTLETGNTLSIQHSDNIISIYKHNSVLLKEVGDLVTAGEAIAIIGNTGEMSSGPHLHFELWHNGRAIDPEEYIHF